MPLLARLEENGRVLLASYRDIAQAIAQGRSISPAAEWLADNFHIVDDQLREVRDDLPRGFYRELPKLAGGPLAGSPRVFGIAWTFVEHTDSRLDLDTLRKFVAAYQSLVPLTIGELWALAISLRLVLVENLRRLAEMIVGRRLEREEADALADLILADDAGPPPDLEERFRVATEGPLPTAFLVQLVARLRDRDPETTPVLRWIEARLAREGTNRDELVLMEHRTQVATHLSVRNVITSMRLMSSVDWAEFFESVSLVEEALRDGTNVAEMDFATRDRYRHAVEDLARGSGVAELEVAKRAVAKGGGLRRGSRRAARRPGLLPDLRRPRRLRKRGRIPPAHLPVASPRVGEVGESGLSRHDRPADPGDPRRAARVVRPRRRRSRGPRAARPFLPGPRVRDRALGHQPGRARARRAAAAPEARARERSIPETSPRWSSFRRFS